MGAVGHLDIELYKNLFPDSPFLIVKKQGKSVPSTKSGGMEIKMNVIELIEKTGFSVIHVAEGAEKTEITKAYCCDLLSIAMSRVPEGAAWVTVMSNLNTLAVASLTEAACVIIAEGSAIDGPVREKAKQQDITLLSTELPVFDAALKVYNEL